MTGLKTAGALTALCAALGACADLTPRPQYPVSAPVAPPPAAAPPAPTPAPAPKADDDAPKASPTTPVGQSALPPPPGARAAPPRKGSALEPRYQTGDGDVTVFAAAAGDASVTVAKGDTLAKIAKAAGVSIEDLAKANRIAAPYRLKIGQTIALPGAPERVPARTLEPKENSGKSKAAKGKGEAPPEPKPARTVTVGKGDTLAKIAKASGVSIEDLGKANNLSPPYRLKIGQTIALSPGATQAAPEPAASAAKPPAKAAPTSVKVGKGQTLRSIADQAGVPVAALAKLNHLKKPYRVRRGQTIKLPAQEEAAAEPAPSPETSSKATSSKAASPKAPAARSAPPRTITAGRHDTLQAIADKAGVPIAELARLNHLKKPYRLKRGQKIRLPGEGAATPEATAAAYKVKKGDTLYSIARQFHTDAKTLADANGLDSKARLTVGRRLQIPGGPLDKPITGRRPSVEQPDTTAPRRAPSVEPAAPVPYSSLPANPPTAPAPGLAPPPVTSTPYRAPSAPQPYTRPAPAPEASVPPPLADADVAAAGRGLFQWPIRGRILSIYGAKPGNQRNDGLDIAGSAGDPVHASAAGEVVYAGNSVPGFGNLVLIRHDGGWVTVYAHLANIDVKMRQAVTQGQQIGEVGQTGGVDQPQLHFEVRYAPNVKDKARLVDPLLVLPQ